MLFSNLNINFKHLNGLNFINPSNQKFPVIKILNKIKNKPSYFETILISINDTLVEKYLKGDIKLTKLIKIPYFARYYNSSPKNIIDIKNMVNKVNAYLNK